MYRLYKQDGLSLFVRRPRRHRSAAQRLPPPATQAINECWAMDFVSDQLYDGRKLRALTLVDVHTRESLAIRVDQGIKGDDVVRTLDAVIVLRGRPERIQVDNGPEFVSKALDRWAYEHRVELAFSRPGKPTDNAHIEAFNGRLRQECRYQTPRPKWTATLHNSKPTPRTLEPVTQFNSLGLTLRPWLNFTEDTPMNLIHAVAAVAVFAVLSVANAADGLVAVKSPHGAKATMDKMEELVKQRGLIVFARIDHAAGAA